VRAPDVGFVRLERAPEPFAEKFVPLAPDLAIEVVSPGDKAQEIEEKVLDYLTYGVRAVWIVYPSARTIVIHTVDGLKRLTVKDTLDGGDILPGFTIPMSEIFPTK
jgi:Uma2 family endonuclease